MEKQTHKSVAARLHAFMKFELRCWKTRPIIQQRAASSAPVSLWIMFSGLFNALCAGGVTQVTFQPKINVFLHKENNKITLLLTHGMNIEL